MKRTLLTTSFVITSLCFVATRALASWEFSPSLSATSTNYFDPLSPNVNENLDAFRASFILKGKLGERWRVKLSPFVQYDPMNLSAREKVFGDLPEGYLEWRGNVFSIEAGQNLITWAGTDGYNPVDVVNARRYFDPLQSEKIGALSAILRAGGEVVDFQLIFIPDQMKSQLPGESSRWLPRDIYVPDTTGVQFLMPSSFYYTYTSDVQLDQALKNNVGAHLQFHFCGSDVALMYFDGSSQTPAIVPYVSTVGTSVQPYIVQANSNFQLQPEYYRIRVSGVSATFPFPFQTLLRLAGAYTQPVSVGSNIPGWSHNSVLGLEHNFSIRSGTLTFVPQFAYGQHQTVSGGEVSSLSHLFDEAGLLGLRYSPNEAWTVTASGLYDFLQHDKFYSLDLAHNFSDHFKGDVNGQYFAGDPGTTIGSYSRNSRVIVTFTWLN